MAKAPAQLTLFEGQDPPPLEVVEPAHPVDECPVPATANDAPDSRVEALVTISASELRAAKGDRELERTALCRYFKRGTGYPMEFLVDILGVSSDVLDLAGYDDEEAQRVMDSIGAITDDEIATVSLE